MLGEVVCVLVDSDLSQEGDLVFVLVVVLSSHVCAGEGGGASVLPCAGVELGGGEICRSSLASIRSNRLCFL